MMNTFPRKNQTLVFEHVSNDIRKMTLGSLLHNFFLGYETEMRSLCSAEFVLHQVLFLCFIADVNNKLTNIKLCLCITHVLSNLILPQSNIVHGYEEKVTFLSKKSGKSYGHTLGPSL